AYQWQRCHAEGASSVALASATNQTYVLVAEDVGRTIRVQETASNAGGSSSPATSAQTAVVTPPPPVNTSPPTITGTAQKGQTLKIGRASWSEKANNSHDQHQR